VLKAEANIAYSRFGYQARRFHHFGDKPKFFFRWRGFRDMKRAAFLAIFCCAALLARPVGAAADAASDRDMASHYAQAAQSGDDDAAFYLGSL
jgi:hypothetical protein